MSNFELDPNTKIKVESEKKTRQKLLADARKQGCEKEMLILFSKYDKLLRNCSNQKEREDIGKLGATEIFFLLGGGGELYINGELIVKDD
jgi:hypothetical protein